MYCNITHLDIRPPTAVFAASENRARFVFDAAESVLPSIFAVQAWNASIATAINDQSLTVHWTSWKKEPPTSNILSLHGNCFAPLPTLVPPMSLLRYPTLQAKSTYSAVVLPVVALKGLHDEKSFHWLPSQGGTCRQRVLGSEKVPWCNEVGKQWVEVPKPWMDAWSIDDVMHNIEEITASVVYFLW